MSIFNKSKSIEKESVYNTQNEYEYISTNIEYSKTSIVVAVISAVTLIVLAVISRYSESFIEDFVITYISFDDPASDLLSTGSVMLGFIVLTLIVTLICVIYLIYFKTKGSKQRKRCKVKINAKIVDIKNSENIYADNYAEVYEYIYNGKTYTKTAKIPVNKRQNNQLGQIKKMYINSKNPDEAFYKIKKLSLFDIFFGMFLVVIIPSIAAPLIAIYMEGLVFAIFGFCEKSLRTMYQLTREAENMK